MTYIKKITMQGFKSFGEGTVSVKLAPGFTCIVGPNGAGKSNIIDALCFCLGRMSKKTMRAKNLTDLIFMGTKSLKPANSASVTITFDNTNREFPFESNELEVEREINAKTGVSKFKINGKIATREALLNILAQANIDPDGSNQFVLQGDIVKVTNMNIIERRQFIESLIGLEKYDQMVENTMKELEKADKDLGKFEAIFKEVSSQLKKYEKEKNDALRWLELDNKIKQHNAELISLRIDKLRKEENELENKIEKINLLIQELEQKQSRQKEKIEQENLVMTNLEDRLNQKNLEKNEIEQSISSLKSELSSKETELKIAKDAIKKLEERKEKLKSLQEPLEEGSTYEDKIQEIQLEIDQLNQEVNDTNQKIDEIDVKISQKDIEISQNEKNKSDLLNEISKNQQQISSFEAEIKMHNKNIKKYNKNLLDAQEELKKLKSEDESIEDAINKVEREKKEIIDKINEIKKQIDEDIVKKRQLEEKITKLENEKALISEKLSNKKAKISSINAEVNLLKKQISDLQNKKENIQKEYQRLSNGKAIEEALNTLKQNEKEQQLKLENLKKKMEELQNQQKDKEHQKNTMELQRRSLENEISDYKTRLSSIETELNINLKDLKSISREQSSIEILINNTKNEIIDLKNKLQNEQAKEINIKSRYNDLIKEREQLNEKIKKADQEYENSKVEIEGILSILSMLSHDIGGSIEDIKVDIQNASEVSLKTSISSFKSFIDDLIDIIKPIEEIPKFEQEKIQNTIPSIIETLKLFTSNVDDTLMEIINSVREANDIAVQQSTSNFDKLISDFVDILDNINLSLKKLGLISSSELTKQLNDVLNEIENYSNNLAETSKNISILLSTINNKENELKNLNQKFESFNLKSSELDDKIKQLEKEKEEKLNFINQIKIKLEENNKLEAEINQSISNFWIDSKKINNEIEQQTYILNKIQDDLRDLKDIQRLIDEMQDIEVQVKSINIEIQNKTSSIENINKEIDSIQQDLQVLQNNIESQKSKREEFIEHRKELDSQIDEQNNLLQNIIHKQKALENIKRIMDEIENLKLDISEAQNKIGENNNEISKINTIIQQIQISVNEKNQRIEELKKHKNELIEQRKELRSILNELNTNLQNKKTRLNLLEQMFQRSKEIEQIEEEINAQDSMIADIDIEIQNLNEQINSKEEERNKKLEEIKNLTKERDSSWERQKSLRDELNEIIAQLSGEQANLQTAQNKSKSLNEQIENLLQNSKEFGTLPPPPLKETENSLIAKIESAKKDKVALEPVNLKAIEYYEEVKERFEEIDMRRQSLQRERKAILDTIERIGLEKTRTFMKTFHEINRNFSVIFQKLSPGGTAKMILERPDKPFEGGILIEARPRGKKISSLDILSGGEKTLVALAFIFAINEIFYSPFFVFDEIDSALDSVNVNRISLLIKELAQNSQFIVISHREENIINAEMIYGVSQVDGLSKIFSITLDQARKMVEEEEKTDNIKQEVS